MGGAQQIRARRVAHAALFGIVQGGMYADLRRESLERLDGNRLRWLCGRRSVGR